MQQHPCKIEESNVDWSGFPSDLLFFISQRLPQLADFIRFRSVCKNWRVSAPPSVAPPQLPWLIKFWHIMDDTYVSSLSSCKTYIVRVPQIKNTQLIGPGHTYVLARDCESDSLSLFNPLTGEEHSLPPLPGYISHIKPMLICKDNITLVCYTAGFMRAFFCRIDDERWSIVEYNRDSMAVSCAYYKGMYFAICGTQEPTKIINATTGQVISKINPPPGFVCYEYMVESFGDILRVQLCCGIRPSFRIYRLDYGDGNSRWIKLRSIGDQILFLANYLTRRNCLYGFTMRSCNVTGSRGNCICLYTAGKEGAGLYRVDIEDNTAEFLPQLSWLAIGGDWFVPSLH